MAKHPISQIKVNQVSENIFSDSPTAAHRDSKEDKGTILLEDSNMTRHTA